MMNQNNLSHEKSQLAKLMASENITVQHRQVRTAYFDTMHRVLVCPIWKDMDGNIYDLLMGHEISHALHTPKEGWHDTITYDKKRKNIKLFLNVIEDARIEKIIKRKYPGLRKPFADAYQTLHERDLFQIKKLKGDYSKLNLIDRINLFFKFGAQTMVTFDKQEQVFVDRTASAETWEQVVEIARDVYDYCKLVEPKKDKQPQSKPQPQQKQEQTDESDDSQEAGDEGEQELDGDDTSGSDSESESADGDAAEGDEEADATTDDAGDEEADATTDDAGDEDADATTDDAGDEEAESKSTDKSDGGKSGSDVKGEPTSETDRAFREMESKLLDTKAPDQFYFDIPEPILKNIIVPNKMVVSDFESRAASSMRYNGLVLSEVQAKLAAAFHARNKSYINLMVKEFEMKKNASQYRRQLQSKSGILDDNKLVRYKFTNDIFRKVTTVEKGKSHGMILFLDLSSSMLDKWQPIIEQLLILVTFCKRIGIPFDVYGFGDMHSYSKMPAGDKFKHTTKSMFIGSGTKFNLRHLLSSRLEGGAYKRAFNMMVLAEFALGRYGADEATQNAFNGKSWSMTLRDLNFGQGGTPFIETLVSSRKIIDEFKSTNKVDITNVVYLTDGDGSQSFGLSQEYLDTHGSGYSTRQDGFQDPITKVRVLSKLDQESRNQAALTELVAKITGCRHIGYYFSSEYEIKQRVATAIDATKNHEAWRQAEAKILTDGFVAIPNLGYSNYYYVTTNTLAYKGELMISRTMTTDHMHKAFEEHMKAKQTSKLVVKQFAAEIAE